MASFTVSRNDGSIRIPNRKNTFHDDADDGDLRSSKRQRTSINEPTDALYPVRRHEQYTVAWICALHIEMAAAEAMLDETHDMLPTDAEDTNTYTLGRVGSHNVVIAGLPTEQYGTNNAANVASNLKRSFPFIRAGLMVGIGGGAPSKCDVRLGDVVVGTRVMQCDLGKSVGDGQLRRTATPRIPAQSIGTAVTALRARHERKSSSIPTVVDERFKYNARYRRPKSPDQLFPATYEHVSTGLDCTGCDLSTLVPRSVRDSPSIHYGAIASGNQVMRSASQRDAIAQELDVICFEMEAAGIMDVIPCLPIRGICDYADSHKNKTWQRYAAATAAAYARELLAILSTSETRSSACVQDSCHIQTANQRDNLLEALEFDQLYSRQSTIDVAHAETCQWLLEDPHYRDWLEPENLTDHHGFLWIRGKPGAGKSTIMKFTYSNMRKRRRKETVTAAFFFNARGQSLEKSIEGMYRSLLIQVIRGFPELQLVLNNESHVAKPKNECPPLEILKELFQNAVLSLGQRSLTCFIDALDECDEQQVMDMIWTFEGLTSRSAAQGIPFWVCFSSRHYPYIAMRKGIEFTLEDRPGHAKDLADYVTNRLRVTDPKLNSELKDRLLEKASGVFLWLSLVVNILNTEYARGGMALTGVLEKMPSNLHALFKDILLRDDANKEQLLLSVLWILCARRPLHPSEFTHAVWAGLCLQGLADPDPPDVSKAVISTNRYVIGSSKGLAEITKGNRPTVQFIHESVRDFLLSAGGLQQLWPGLGFDWEIPTHEKLKRCAEAYIGHPSVSGALRRVPSGAALYNKPDILKRFPFLGYSVHNVLYHADAAAKGIPQDEFLSTFSWEDWIHMSNLLSNLLDEYRTFYNKYDAGILYILADRGFSNLIRTRLRKSPTTGVMKAGCRNAIYAALVHGKGDAAAALLGLPSNIYEGEDIARTLESARSSRTLLTWAAQEGGINMCNLLFQKGYDVEGGDSEGDVPLSIASKNGQHAVAKLLVEQGASIYSCALILAANSGHHATFELLLHAGWQEAHRDNVLKMLILKATQDGMAGAVKFLLREAANVHDDEILLDRLLAMAVRHGRYEVSALLINEGANVTGSSQDLLPMALAHPRRPRRLVMLLAQKGADITYCSGDLLFFAIEHGEESLARLAISKGADVNAKTMLPGGDILRPLLIAVKLVNEPFARLLLEFGADVNLCDAGNVTPLYTAASRGHETIVELLIEYGADVNVDVISPIRAALEGGHRAIARLLVEKGANVPHLYRNLV